MSAWPQRTCLSFVLASLLLATAVGCGGVGNVSGEVKVKDKPVLDGVIIFRQVSTKKAVSAEIKDGKYSATKVPTGEAVVLITGNLEPPAPPETKGKKKPDKKPKGGKDKGKEKETPPTVNPKYSNPKSAMTYTVTSGDQEKDFILDP
jgi:hypothetical protein